MLFWKLFYLHKHISHPCPLDSRISKHGSKAREFSLLAPHDWEYTTTCQRLRNRERQTEWQRQGGRSVISISAEAWLSASSSIWHSGKQGMELLCSFSFFYIELLWALVPAVQRQCPTLCLTIRSTTIWSNECRQVNCSLSELFLPDESQVVIILFEIEDYMGNTGVIH